MDTSVPEDQHSRPQEQDERRWTAVLFTDMVNYSTITDQIGSENAYRLMAQVIDLAMDIVEKHGGRPLSFAGDSILASFGAPVALEDASLAACTAALDFVRKVEENADRLEKRFKARPVFRVGISGGMVVIGRLRMSERMDLNIMGQPVNEAARLEAQAAPGQILISADIHDQVQGAVMANALGARQLKGIGTPVEIFELTGLQEGVSRFMARNRRGLTDLSGRGSELERLVGYFTVRAEAPRVAVISAPPGIGKSRLLHSLTQSLGETRRILLGQCTLARQAVPYAPFIEILRNAAGVGANAPLTSAIEKFRASMGSGGDFADLDLLTDTGRTEANTSPDSLARRLRRVMIELIRTIAQDTPTLFEIEDAHWIDATSSALLGAIVAGEAGTAPQVAITGRPEFDPGWAAEDGVLALRLEPLKEGDVRAMIRSVLGVATVEPRLERIVVDKSEGTPLFVEEILRSLRQRDALVVMADSAALAPDAAEDAADGNLQQLVLQGVDRLSPEVKPILYAAAAMGRNFSHSVLSEIAPPARVEAALEVAGERGLVEYDPTSGEDGWRFSHALLRDAVYSSLLDEARETVHGQIALAMERAPSLHNRDLSQELGYHFSKAGMGRNAVPHLLQAARNNLQVYALSQAKALLAQAAEFLEEDPDILTATEFTRMVRDQVSVGLNIGDSRMIIDAVEQDLERLRSTDNPSDYERIISHYSWALSHARRYDEALEVAEEAAAKARDRGDLLSAAWQQVGYLRACNETHKLGTDQFMAVANDALETARKHGEVRLEMQILYLMSAEFRAAGDFRSSRECCRRLEQLAEEYNEPRAIGFSRWTESVLYQMAREFGTALRLAEEARAVSVPETADAHVSDGIAVGAIVNGPDPTSAAPIIEEIRRKATEFLDYNLIDLMEVCQAVMELRTGRLAQGWHRFQSVVDTASQRGNRSHLLAMILVRAEVRARIAGLVENDEPEEYQVRDPMKLGLKDLMLALRIRLGSRKGVLQDIADYEATAPEWVGGAWRARFLLTRSLIEKDPARKRADLEEVEVLARQEGLEFLAKRASVLLQGMA